MGPSVKSCIYIGFLLATGAMAAIDMGPAAFLWPPDRTWSSNTDNTPPCGAASDVRNRTDFPLTGGRVALVVQDDAYSVHLSISFDNDPQTTSDFKLLIAPSSFATLNPGSTCVNVPDAPPGMETGSNATLQLKYVADFDNPGHNDTFYACSDLRYVPASEFTKFSFHVPCFNVTIEDWDGEHARAGGLSKGEVAGAVVGSIAGIGLVGIAAGWMYRERKQKNRLKRQQVSVRGIMWSGRQAGKEAPATSEGDVRMQSLS